MLWKLRAVVYGGAAAVIALLLIGLGGDEEKPFLEGRTAQGNRFTMELEDGRPVNLGARLDATCDHDDLEWWARWWSFDGKTTRFHFEDGELEVREKVSREYDDDWKGEREHSLTARVDDDGVRGTMRYVETLTNGVYLYRCSSGAVSFSAG